MVMHDEDLLEEARRTFIFLDKPEFLRGYVWNNTITGNRIYVYNAYTQKREAQCLMLSPEQTLEVNNYLETNKKIEEAQSDFNEYYAKHDRQKMQECIDRIKKGDKMTLHDFAEKMFAESKDLHIYGHVDLNESICTSVHEVLREEYEWEKVRNRELIVQFYQILQSEYGGFYFSVMLTSPKVKVIE